MQLPCQWILFGGERWDGASRRKWVGGALGLRRWLTEKGVVEVPAILGMGLSAAAQSFQLTPAPATPLVKYVACEWRVVSSTGGAT